MPITIKEVSTKAEFNAFISFYTWLYKNNKQVAFPLHFLEKSTLNPAKNPAFRFCTVKYWLAYQNNQVVGRIAAIINTKEQEKLGEHIARIGWFDFIDDVNISSRLMDCATKWLKNNLVTKVHGPMGFTDYDRQGCLIEGNDLPGTMGTNYNYPYYARHFEHMGYAKSIDWIEFLVRPPQQATERFGKIGERCKRSNRLTSVKFKSTKELKGRANELFELINKSFENIYGYIALTTEQMDYYKEEFLGFINLKLISIVCNEDDKMVGVGIAMPSFQKALQKTKGKLFSLQAIHLLKALYRNDCIDLCFIAVDEAYQGKGVNAIIMHDIITGAASMGAPMAETNIELENNNKVHQMWKTFDGKQHKRRRCYYKMI